MENTVEKTYRPEYLEPDQEAAAVASAVAEFPAEFGLAAFPGKTFRVSPTASYYSPGWDHGDGNRSPAGVQVYTQVKNDDGAWIDFAKGTVGELRRELRPSPRYLARRDEIEAESDTITAKYEDIDEAQHDLDERRRKLGERFDTLFATATDELDAADFYDVFGTYPDESGKTGKA